MDPGNSGGIVLHTSDGKYHSSLKMPLNKDDQVCFKSLNKLFSQYKKEHSNLIVIHEAITEHYKGGRKSSFSFGRGYEALINAIENNDIPRVSVNPKKWQDIVFEGIEKVYSEGVSKTGRKTKKHETKQTALLAKERYYPGLSLKRTVRCKSDDDGLVDALLIGLYFFKSKK